MMENNELRERLRFVRYARPQVVEREADKNTLSLLSSNVQTYVFDAGKSRLDSITNAYRVLLIFVIANMGMFSAWTCNSRKGSLPQQGKQSTVRGYHCKVIEISEMQVSGLAPGLPQSRGEGSDICLSVQTGHANELRTAGKEFSHEGFLRYEERFMLQVQCGGCSPEDDGCCHFSVLKRSGGPNLEAGDGRGQRIAELEMPWNDLLRLAKTTRQGDGFSFDLVPAPQESRRPCLTMKIRDLSTPEGGSKHQSRMWTPRPLRSGHRLLA